MCAPPPPPRRRDPAVPSRAWCGADPNMMSLFSELGIHDRLQWKVHKMISAMQELPGEFTTFDFIPGIPAPFNFGLAILLNQKMPTLGEKIQTAPPLLPMLIKGQDFIDAQDEVRAATRPAVTDVGSRWRGRCCCCHDQSDLPSAPLAAHLPTL